MEGDNLDENIIEILKWIEDQLSTPHIKHNIFVDEWNNGYKKALSQIKDYIELLYSDSK